MKKLFAKRFVGDQERVISIPADAMERDDSLIYAFRNEQGKQQLVACVSIGSYDVIYLAEDSKQERK